MNFVLQFPALIGRVHSPVDNLEAFSVLFGGYFVSSGTPLFPLRLPWVLFRRLRQTKKGAGRDWTKNRLTAGDGKGKEPALPIEIGRREIKKKGNIYCHLWAGPVSL